jgi:hypothetical protein
VRFAETSCSSCGCDLGPGDSGLSHCRDHGPVDYYTDRAVRLSDMDPDYADRIRDERDNGPRDNPNEWAGPFAENH